MKVINKISVCALLAAGFVTSTFGQIQTAGNLLVDVDATAQPAGVYTSLANNGTLGGVFLANNSGVAGVSNLIVALGGNGTHGALMDGSQNSLRHYTTVAGTTIVNPPAGIVGTAPVFSVEAWMYKATLNDDGGPVAWGNRSVSGANVACNWGRNAGWGGLTWQGTGYDHGWATAPSVGSWHHLVWTYDSVATGTGAGTIRLYRDGVLDKAEVQTNAPNISATNSIWLCVEHSGTGTAVFSAGMLGKVRIHDGVLSAAQVVNNYNYEAPLFTNGTPATLLAMPPIHRYSFNLPPTNNAIGLTVPDTGSSNGPAAIIRGNSLAASAGWPYFDGTQVVLPNYGGNSPATNGYVDMPNGILSSLSSSNGGPGMVSLELWFEVTAATTWSEVLYMGSCGNGEINGTGTASTGGANGIIIPGNINGNHEQSGFRSASLGNYTVGSRFIGSRKHVVVTWEEASNLIKVYHEGVQVGQWLIGGKMNSIVDVNNWLGRSGWNDAGLPANFREFRMYNRLLSPAEVRRNYLAGPSDALDSTMVVWDGTANGNWDLASADWLVSGVSASYADGKDVVFNDSATGPTLVTNNITVLPKSVSFQNSAKSYTLSGAGNISGTSGLTKNGNGTLTLAGPQTNDYTGPNLLLGGKVVVSNLGNGGVPSALGAASADPTNLVLRGGTLSYQGPAITINRGYTASEVASTIEVQNGLNFSGPLKAYPNGAMVKTGPGTLTYSSAGSNLLSAGTFPGYQIVQGTVVFDGAGTQTNRNMSEFWVGSGTNYGVNLLLNNTIMYLDSWFGVGRGNGNVGNTSTVTLSNSVVTTAANGLSMGFNNGLPNLANQVVTLKGASVLNLAGVAEVGNSTGSSAKLLLNDNSWVRLTGGPRVGMNMNSTGLVVLANSATLTNTAYASIGLGSGSAGQGSGGVGTMIVKDNAVWNHTGDFNVTDLANSVGELDISNNATILVNGTVYIGKATGTLATVNQAGGSFLKTAGGDFLIGGSGTGAADSIGIWNMTGGFLSINGNFQPGAYGQGTVNQSAGTVLVNSWISIGRYVSSLGNYNISGGLLFVTNTGTDLIVGEAGNGTLTITAAGNVVSTNAVRIGNLAGAAGTVNLSGGTLNTKRIYMANLGAYSTFNFNGGLLQAAAGASSDFMSGLSIGYILAGGARVDTGTNNITIAQDLYTDNSGGGFTKYGSGLLYLAGYLYHTGPTLVNAGTLMINTHALGGGSISVSDGATLALQVLDYNGANLSASGLGLGSASGSTMTFNLGSFGNPSVAPLNVSSGTVTLNGVTTINIDPASSLSVGEFPLVSYGSLAGSGTLALGTVPPGVTAHLTNDVTASPTFIGLVVESVFLPRWEGLAGGTWDVQVTTNWLDVITLAPQFFYQGTRALFDDSALGTTSVSLVTNVAPGGVVVSNSILSYSIAGVGRITGGGGLTKQGSGSLTLSTTNNTYTGGTFIDEGGTLVSTVANNLGTNGSLTIGTGTLSLAANSQKFSNVNVTNGNIAASGATVTASAYNLDNGSVNAVLAGGTLNTFGTNTDLLNLSSVNTYTGRTYLAGSVLAVSSLANGGAPSGIGASSAGPTNLVFAGGGLSYSGPAVATDRGYNVQNGGSLSASGNVTLNGPIVATAGLFTKGGPAAVTYSAPGTNVLSRGSYYVGAGSVVLNGGASTPTNYLQTNLVVGEVWVGYDQANAGNLVLTNTALNVSSWLAIDRGNGTLGSQSIASLYDSAATVANCSMGYANDISGNWTKPVLNLFGNSRFVDSGTLLVGESVGAEATMNILGTSVATITGSTRLGATLGTCTGMVTVANSGSLVVNGSGSWLSVGANGVGIMSLADNAYVLNYRDENVGDVSGSDGTLNISGNATNLTANLYVGKSGAAIGVVNQSGGFLGRYLSGAVTYVEWRVGGGTAADTTATGTFNLSGGTVDTDAQNFQVGAYGIGFYNQSGGTFNCSVWPSMGRYPGSQGTLVISGGVFNQTGTGNRLIIGEQGSASLTVTNTAFVNCLGGLTLGHQATGVGVVNLDGGRIATPLVAQPGGATASGTFNFNGGVLQANANNTTFMTGLAAANILAGGAIIDSSSNSITISQALLDGGTGGGLTKVGAGTLALSGVNTYLGSTVVSNGTLRINGSILDSADAKPGATIGGSGAIGGNVVVEAGATLSPGASVGTLTISNNLTIAGNLFIELDKTLAQSNDLTVVLGTLNNAGSGILTVTNLGAIALAAGDSFKLFSQPLPGGNALTIVPALGAGLAWTNHLAVDGSIAIIATMATYPTNLTVSVGGGNVNISWPTDHTGWRLQVQTNSLSTGLSNNWADVPGSTTVNQMSFPIGSGNGAVFYRMAN